MIFLLEKLAMKEHYTIRNYLNCTIIAIIVMLFSGCTDTAKYDEFPVSSGNNFVFDSDSILYRGEFYSKNVNLEQGEICAIFKNGEIYFYHTELGDPNLIKFNENTSRVSLMMKLLSIYGLTESSNNIDAISTVQTETHDLIGVRIDQIQGNKYSFENTKRRLVGIKLKNNPNESGDYNRLLLEPRPDLLQFKVLNILSELHKHLAQTSEFDWSNIVVCAESNQAEVIIKPNTWCETYGSILHIPINVLEKYYDKEKVVNYIETRAMELNTIVNRDPIFWAYINFHDIVWVIINYLDNIAGIKGYDDCYQSIVSQFQPFLKGLQDQLTTDTPYSDEFLYEQFNSIFKTFVFCLSNLNENESKGLLGILHSLMKALNIFEEIWGVNEELGFRSFDIITNPLYDETLLNIAIIKVNEIFPSCGFPGDDIVIKGQNFGNPDDNSYVLFSGVKVTDYLSWKDSEIRLKVPLISKSGDVYVYVNNVPSNGKHFVYGCGSGNKLLITRIVPTETVTKDWGQSQEYKIEVEDGKGNKVQSFEIKGSDKLQDIGIDVDGKNGEATYTTEVPQGKQNGSYELQFIAIASVYDDSDTVNRFVKVNHDEPQLKLSIEPVVTVTKDWGQYQVYTIRVNDGKGNLVQSFEIEGSDGLQDGQSIKVSTNNGVASYTTTVPQGKPNDQYQLEFIAKASGYINSNTERRYVNVYHPEDKKQLNVSVSPESQNVKQGESYNFTIKVTSNGLPIEDAKVEYKPFGIGQHTAYTSSTGIHEAKDLKVASNQSGGSYKIWFYASKAEYLEGSNYGTVVVPSLGGELYLTVECPPESLKVGADYNLKFKVTMGNAQGSPIQAKIKLLNMQWFGNTPLEFTTETDGTFKYNGKVPSNPHTPDGKKIGTFTATAHKDGYGDSNEFRCYINVVE